MLGPRLAGEGQLQEESGEGKAPGKKDVVEYIKIFTGKARAIQLPPMPAHTLFLNKKKKISSGSQSYIYAKQARKPSGAPGAGNEPKQGHCVQATGWLRGHC